MNAEADVRKCITETMLIAKGVPLIAPTLTVWLPACLVLESYLPTLNEERTKESSYYL